MKVCVVGMGYIGFPTACIIAGAGHEVIGVDTNKETVHRLNNGELHIENEKGLYVLSRDVLQNGKLKIKEKPEKAELFIIAVPTPCREEEEGFKRADLSYVKMAAESIAPYLEKDNLVVLESTVPPGTTEEVVGKALEETGLSVGKDIFLAFAPERVLPGNIMEELLYNDRLIGGVDAESGKRARDFYASFIKGKIHICSAREAEMAKLMENAYRDVNIALANEMALLAEKAGVNSYEAIELANNHPRVNVLRPGPGVGGHCIAEDPWFLIGISHAYSPLLQMARRINLAMPQHVLELFLGLQEEHDIERVAVLGASYKANVGDARNSPGLKIVEMIKPYCKEVAIHDPYIKEYSGDLQNVLINKDLFILTTDHQCYKESLTPEGVGEIMSKKIAFDTRGFLGREWDKLFKVVRLGIGQA